MIIVLEKVRTTRMKALRALRALHYLDPSYENNIQRCDPIEPGLKQAQGMLNSLPLEFWILPESLPEFEEDFFLQVKPEPPPFDPFGGICAHITYPHGEIAIKGDAKHNLPPAGGRLSEGEHLCLYTWIKSPWKSRAFATSVASLMTPTMLRGRAWSAKLTSRPMRSTGSMTWFGTEIQGSHAR